MKNNLSNNIDENGNVLFMILIAVALFAALSYAVMQTNSPGGDSGQKETNLIRSSQLTQTPLMLKTAITRMTFSGADRERLLFNGPTDFGSGKPIDTLAEEKLAVFHTNGGGLTYSLAPSEVMEDGTARPYIYNAEMQIENIGLTDVGSGDGNDIVSYLTGLKKEICKQLNSRLGIQVYVDGNGNGVPDVGGFTITDLDRATVMDHDYAFPTSDGTIIGDDFSGQPFGCFENTDSGEFVYYHVLLER